MWKICLLTAISANFGQTYPLAVIKFFKNQNPVSGISSITKFKISISLNRLIISRPAIIVPNNFDCLGRRVHPLVVLAGSEDNQMSENLLYDRLFIDETDDAHFTSALGVHSRHISCCIRFGL